MSFPFHYLLFLLLILCVSPHACNSIHLGLLNKEAKNELRLTGKDFLKKDEVLEKTVNVLKHRRRSIFEELQPEDLHVDEIRVEKSAEKTEIKHAQQDQYINLQLLKGRKMQARSIVESKNQDDNDENIKSQENEGTAEDVVVMDYAQPHRKPPIHNLEP